MSPDTLHVIAQALAVLIFFAGLGAGLWALDAWTRAAALNRRYLSRRTRTTTRR